MVCRQRAWIERWSDWEVTNQRVTLWSAGGGGGEGGGQHEKWTVKIIGIE